ncbi:MAG: hypothetical protein R6U57_00545 [Anaerolineales bacterium]
MPVWIERVNIEYLGPLGEQKFDFDRFNMIYGANETGKTFLVEFLLRSLFRHASQWPLRNLPGRGIVTLRGVGEGPIEFTPDSRKKLEDYWKVEESGLPANMAQLLVVKGGELDLSREAPGGVGRAVLKNTLSRETLLDQILEPIQQTIQNASIHKGEIIADRRGKIKDRESLMDDLRRMDGLFETLESKYSRGPIRSLELRLEKVQASLEKQERAKRYLAYQLSKKVNEWKETRKNLPDRKLETLRDHIRDYQKTQSQLAEKKEDLAEKEETSHHYLWLKNALETWETQDLDRSGQPRPIFALIGIVLIFIGLALSFTNQPLLGLGPSLIGLISLAYYTWRLRLWSGSAAQSQEREDIQKTYQDRFGDHLDGIVELKTRLESVREIHIQANQIRSDIEGLEEQKNQLTNDIRSELNKLTGEEVGKDDWEEKVNALRDKAKKLDENIKEVEMEQYRLGIDETEYRSHPAQVPYDEKEWEVLQEETNQIQAEIREAEEGLERLKQNVCKWTRDDIDTPWNKALQHLQEEHEHKVEEYKQLTAEIVAKIGVTQVLEQVHEQEDEKIRHGLRSKEVTEILESVTGTYHSLDLTGEQVQVKGIYGDYPLRALSTGAQEQILLALRMGFASRLAGGQPLFMILDDAFQHSDWQRRERLVKKAIHFAKHDWQVVYLTMDDHLRDLFLDAGKTLFPEEFTYHELG